MKDVNSVLPPFLFIILMHNKPHIYLSLNPFPFETEIKALTLYFDYYLAHWICTTLWV